MCSCVRNFPEGLACCHACLHFRLLEWSGCLSLTQTFTVCSPLYVPVPSPASFLVFNSLLSLLPLLCSLIIVIRSLMGLYSCSVSIATTSNSRGQVPMDNHFLTVKFHLIFSVEDVLLGHPIFSFGVKAWLTLPRVTQRDAPGRRKFVFYLEVPFRSVCGTFSFAEATILFASRTFSVLWRREFAQKQSPRPFSSLESLEFMDSSQNRYLWCDYQ